MAETTQIRWTDDEGTALDAGAARLAGLMGRPVTRPELVRVLVRAWGAGVAVEELVRGSMGSKGEVERG